MINTDLSVNVCDRRSLVDDHPFPNRPERGSAELYDRLTGVEDPPGPDTVNRSCVSVKLPVAKLTGSDPYRIQLANPNA